jgi:hypothetical protein
VSAQVSSTWAEGAIFVVFLLATTVSAWIGVLYLMSPHASESALPRR